MFKSLLTFFFLLATLVMAAFAGAKIAESAPSELPQAYYVHSEDPALKALLGVNHEFNGVFSAELTGTELALLKRLGVKTEPVQLRNISRNHKCGDGICQGFENANSCPSDCSLGGVEPTPTPTPEPSSRSCTPDNQKPYGITMVNGGSGGAGVKVAVLDT